MHGGPLIEASPKRSCTLMLADCPAAKMVFQCEMICTPQAKVRRTLRFSGSVVSGHWIAKTWLMSLHETTLQVCRVAGGDD
jgi:hypothetical protein